MHVEPSDALRWAFICMCQTGMM